MEQRSYSNGGPIRILSIGKFVPRKNHLLLLKALSEIVHLRSFHLTLVGEASSFAHQSYVKLVQKKILALGLSPYVTILTNVPFRHMSNLYMNNDVFVIPSRDERLSVALVEAMAHGLSVLAGTGNAAAEYIHVGKNGFVFLKENLEDLISKLLMMTASRHQSQQMGEQSLILARQFHHPAIFHKKLKQIIKSRWGISLRS
jgi:glycosyltransferase involved in cell wall biosynthesis